MAKLQLVYNDSPCSVLGVQGPVSSSDVKKAFRQLSMCMHPDRLRGRLQRSASDLEERRGQMLFTRASAAKDELEKMLKAAKKKKIPCYQGELEQALVIFFVQVGRALTNLGIGDVWSMCVDIFWSFVTFEKGIFNTLLSALWFAFVFRNFKALFMYLWRLGAIRGTVAVVTTVVIGPLPTVVNFVGLPVMRLGAFVKGLRPAPEPPAAAEPAAAKVAATAAAAVGGVTMNAALKAREDLPARNVKQRKKKETEEEKEKRNKELLAGGPEGQATAPVDGATAMPDGVWQCVLRSHNEPVKARQYAAAAVQFDLLLILTKPIIPLCTLITTGQVWNGVVSSLVIGHALRKWVPQMSHEAHHLLCSLFGALHTLLGVSAAQVEDYANREGMSVLNLSWSWSYKDILAVMHMCTLGATVSAMAGLGNEPSYAASFASGIALRVLLAQDSVKAFGFVKQAGHWIDARSRDLGVSLVAAEEATSYSGGGIGDCGGGPFRMLFGDGPQARWAALILKAWLMLIPVLAMAHWFQRSIHAGKMLGKRWKLTRFVQRVILFSLGLVQCYMLFNIELNASNGALENFWVAMLFGCAGESLLSTYDIRGHLRSIIFLLLFLLI